METGLRMRVSWLPSFGLFFESPHFTDQAKLTFLGSVCDHAEFLYSFRTNRNHLIRETNGLLAVAIWLPEFSRAGKWLDAALARLEEQLLEQVNDDGSHIELSTGYQWLMIDEFETSLNLLRAGDQKRVQDMLLARLRDMYEFMAYLLRPDGSFPQINDGFLLWSADRLEESAKRLDQPGLEYISSRLFDHSVFLIYHHPRSKNSHPSIISKDYLTLIPTFIS